MHLSHAASREDGSKADQLGVPFGQHDGDNPRSMLLSHYNNSSSLAKLAGMVDDFNRARVSGMIDRANDQLYTLTVDRARLFLRITRRRQRHRRSFHIRAAELHSKYTESPHKFESATPTHRAAGSKATTPSTTSLHDDAHLGHKSPFTPREDRIGQPISLDNAQAPNPPDACVFVAKQVPQAQSRRTSLSLQNSLQSNESGAELQGAIEQAFHRYGDCWVKVRRDGRGMPFAFVQYRLKTEAEVALIPGKNLVIHGRQCRTETARAQRALYVSRKDGEMPSEEEVRQLLEKAGPIEKIFTPTETIWKSIAWQLVSGFVSLCGRIVVMHHGTFAATRYPLGAAG